MSNHNEAKSLTEKLKFRKMTDSMDEHGNLLREDGSVMPLYKMNIAIPYEDENGDMWYTNSDRQLIKIEL